MAKQSFQHQIDIIKKTSKAMETLNLYAMDVNVKLNELNLAWGKNQDKFFVLSAVADCVNEASDIYYVYNEFSVNAVEVAKKMDLLESVKEVFQHTSVSKVKAISIERTSGIQKLVVSYDSFDDLINTMARYTDSINSIKLKTSKLGQTIDQKIVAHVKSEHSLTAIQKRIAKLISKNEYAIGKLRMVKEAYIAAEKEIDGVVTDCVLKGESSGSVDSSLKKTYVAEQSKIEKRVNVEAKVYPVINNMKELCELQVVRGDCYVTSCAMLLKRLLYLNGEDYQNVNRNTVRETVTGSANDSSQLVKNNFDYTSDSGTQYEVNCYMKDDAAIYGTSFVNLNSQEKADRLKMLLKEHPEGIIIWGNSASKQNGAHAVLLTSYHDGQFYCCDPATESEGEIPLVNSWDGKSGDTDYSILDRITQYNVATMK